MMPSRTQPGSGHFTFQHLMTAAAGLVGVYFAAATNILERLEPVTVFTVWVWSLVFIFSGTLGSVARWRGLYRAETYAADITSGAVVLWALMIVLVSRPVGGPLTQVGIWMVGAASMLHGWAVYRRYRLEHDVELREQVTSAVLREFEGE